MKDAEIASYPMIDYNCAFKVESFKGHPIYFITFDLLENEAFNEQPGLHQILMQKQIIRRINQRRMRSR